MGLTQRLGTIPLAIQTDSSNNVGIGGAANASYKLAVTGASLFSGALTATGQVEGTIINSTSNAFRLSGNNALSLVTLNSQSVVKINAAGFWGVQLVGANDNGIVINNTGQVGINTSTPARLLDVRGPVNLSTTLPTIGTTSGAYADVHLRTFSGYPSAQAKIVVVDYFFDCYSTYTDGFRWFNYDSAGTTPVERMRITSGGNVGIGVTSPSSQLEVNGDICVVGSGASLSWANRSGSGRFSWYAPNGNFTYLYNLGNIGQFSMASGVYTALSDVNKKKDFEDSTIGLEAILGLKPTLYRMKNADENSDKELGFIAQQVKEFIPQAYMEDGEGEDKFIGLSDRPIIAALVKAIQELNAKVTALENK